MSRGVRVEVVRVRHVETVGRGAEQSPACLLTAEDCPSRSGHLLAPGLLAAAGHVGDGDIEALRQTDTVSQEVLPACGRFHQNTNTAIVSTVLQTLRTAGLGGPGGHLGPEWRNPEGGIKIQCRCQKDTA